MKISGETKFFFLVIIATIVLVVGGVIFLSRSAPVLSREELIPAGSHTQGSDTASVYLVEFSDFQCPACGAAKPFVDEIVATFKDKLTFSYRHFPLDQHQFAFKGAVAAEAAGEQGKFWQMYDYIFENQENLSDELFKEGAKALELDITKFEEALKNEKNEEKVRRDISDGRKFGVNSTPTFFLDGKKLDLYSHSDLKTSVEKAINAK